ncbi:MAG: methionine--tRNA ligase, partial [Planctomycetota bacterium]|nr:methionine--tRNA ligase [Planctomycetota bacterium]
MSTFDDFKHLDIRVARVTAVENHPNAEKLYVLKIDLGDSQRQIVAGLKKHYQPEELQGKLIVVITNLPPVELRGVRSEGMLL